MKGMENEREARKVWIRGAWRRQAIRVISAKVEKLQKQAEQLDPSPPALEPKLFAGGDLARPDRAAAVNPQAVAAASRVHQIP